jgi:hypothetical protein
MTGQSRVSIACRINILMSSRDTCGPLAGTAATDKTIRTEKKSIFQSKNDPEAGEGGLEEGGGV